ncbi:MAG: tRNA (adenosine(37)-N6)-dimethylallyltransferase MiaA [Bacteroidia bacterium]|nr:tRNA (adenosine(37)-N6)-dimethylallyltransferase MiaA [Bacteroidia bacterium]
MHKTLLVVTGPTAVGKTALSISLAQHYQTEIISTDARQFYKEMNIGTAKPSAAEMGSIKHHFINNQTIHHLYSAGEFEKEALGSLHHLFKLHDLVIAVGGSGLYLKALCEGLDDMPDADLVLREELKALFKNEGIKPLQEQLKELDPVKWLTIDWQNPQRLMRAIEIAKQKKVPVQPKKLRHFKIIKAGLQMERTALYSGINSRVDKMMHDGLLQEAETLFVHRELNALQTVGYTELFKYLEGKITLEAAVGLIKQHTRNFAKRQITWLSKDKEISWFDPIKTDLILEWITAESLKH